VRVMGIIFTVIIVGLAIVAIGVGLMSIPDIKRYLAIRRM
jgi:hypothetical protein